jgi:hypothetical protein
MSKETNQTERADDAPVKTVDVKQLYERPPSFTDLLPWAEYLPESRSFLLEDGISVGVLFELTPVGTEARTSRVVCRGIWDGSLTVIGTGKRRKILRI